MSLINQKLSTLKAGSAVRFTQRNGHIIDGVVIENDGTDSIAVKIMSTAFIRYEDISSLEELSATASVAVDESNTNNTSAITKDFKISFDQNVGGESAEDEKDVTIYTVECSKDIIKQIFKKIDGDAKKALTVSYDKYQSFLSSHDSSKLDEAVNLILDTIDDMELEFDENVNTYCAYVALVKKDFYKAALSFYFAKNFRYAYCTAFQAAVENNDDDFYTLAAVFAALYVIAGNTENLAETAEVIKICSEKLKDLCAVRYICKNSKNAAFSVFLWNIIEHLGSLHGVEITDFSNLRVCINSIHSHYPVVRVGVKFSEFNDFEFDNNSDKDDKDKEKEKDKAKEEEKKSDDTPSETPASVDTNQTYQGQISSYKFFEQSGIITDEDGNSYAFDLSDVSDDTLEKQLRKTSKKELKINVSFQLMKRMRSYCAVKIKTIKQEVSSNTSTKNPKALFAKKKYAEAIEGYKKMLASTGWEEAFSQIIMCYICLWNQKGDLGYSDELKEFVEIYKDKVSSTNNKTMEALYQYNMKSQNYVEAINMLNNLIELCSNTEYSRILHYIHQKERCYYYLKDYPSAVSQLLDWLDIVERNKLCELYQTRNNSIYIEIAEVYFAMGDFESSEKYYNLSVNNERKKTLANKLNALKNTEQEQVAEETEEPDDENEDIILDEQEDILQAAYDEYIDESSFDSLNMNDIDVAGKISIFNEGQLHCLLTYLHAASEISASSKAEYADEKGTNISVNSSIQVLNNAFGYAFNSPFLSKEYSSTEIISVFEQSKRLIEDINSKLFAAASLFALFNHQTVPDYQSEDMVIVVESDNLSQNYPTLIPLVNTLCSFKTKTGYGMDVFADYKTNSSVMDKIIAEANACCEAIDMRGESYESQGQVRRTREYIFSSENSELRKCLDIAASNESEKISYVKAKISEMFLRNGKTFSVDNTDIKKIDTYIDSHWDLARDVIRSEGRHVSRPYDKIKGSKRTNIVVTIKRIVSCICDWVEIAENSESNENIYAKELYAENSPNVINYLTEIITACKTFKDTHGFDWGNESIRFAAAEILAKLDGTYDSRARKYMFIDFLRGEDILLNDKYLPEFRSTFCGWKNFNILSRIERHATHEHLNFEDRITEILSEVESKHNFRTVQLIKNYAEDMHIDSISGHGDFAQLGECLKQAKQHFEGVYHDFNDEIEMYESYGRISDVNGEKTNFLKLALDWYKITRITNDYGFYTRLLDIIRDRIATNALEHGESLKRQLEELVTKPEYDFGVYPKESIMARIDDQNYTVAEYMLNCIRRHDTKSVNDYTTEPFGFFNGFMKEHPTNYRITYGSGEKLAGSVIKYAGLGFRSGSRTEDTLVIAMKQITNNAMKDIKGGCNLINNWIWANPAGKDRIEKLLVLLGINVSTVSADVDSQFDSYIAYCKKQTGKINYPHPIPAFSSSAQDEGFRVLCLYGKYNCKDLMETFRNVNTVAKHTIVFLNFALNQDERRKLARQIKEEKTFARTFIVIDRVILMYLAKHYNKTDINKMLMAVTMPFAYYQPFVESSSSPMPPELFTGREAELTSIESPEGANLVYGGRQLGKSALLKMAQHNINGNSNNDRAIYVEIQKMNYTDAAKSVSSELVIAGILPEGSECDDWNVLASNIKRRLLDENPETRINYLLLMLDEADEFIGTSVRDGNVPITALKNLPSNRFKLVMAGLHNLSRYNRQAFIGNNSTLIHLKSIIIRPFQRPEAIKLLTNTLAYLGFRFKPDVISLILSKTNYFPGLIQLYCQKLIEAMRDDYAGYNEISTPPYEVTESHFKKVLSDSQFMDMVNQKLEITLFAEETGHSYYHIIALVLSFLCYTENSDKGYNMDDIFRIAENYDIKRLRNISREQLEELLHEMWDLNILTSEDEYYKFATKDFREMLGKQEAVEKSMSEYCGEDEYK